MSICHDCTKERTCKNKWLNNHDGCKKYDGVKYWRISSDEWQDFYAKAETASKAKYAMFKVITSYYDYEEYTFREFVNSGLYVTQVDSLSYDCHKEIGWCA